MQSVSGIKSCMVLSALIYLTYRLSGPPLPERAAQVELARCHLPEYLCNCLLACGFDTLKAIAKMKEWYNLSCSKAVIDDDC